MYWQIFMVYAFKFIVDTLKEQFFMSKKVFISFDYDDDRDYKNLLTAWNKNERMDFSFEDCSADEIHSDDISKIKAGLTRRINQSRYTLVIIGKDASKFHVDRKEIGYNNWIEFEIAQSKNNKNKIIALKLNKSYISPGEILNSGARWAMNFTQEAIMRALNEA